MVQFGIKDSVGEPYLDEIQQELYTVTLAEARKLVFEEKSAKKFAAYVIQDIEYYLSYEWAVDESGKGYWDEDIEQNEMGVIEAGRL